MDLTKSEDGKKLCAMQVGSEEREGGDLSIFSFHWTSSALVPETKIAGAFEGGGNQEHFLFMA